MRLAWLFLTVSCFGQSFYGAGISAYPQTSPKPTGWAANVTTENAKQGVASFSEVDFTVIKSASGKGFSLQTSIRTGQAVQLRTFGKSTLYALGDAGMATTGANTGLAGALGGQLVTPTKWAGWSITYGARVLKSALGASQVLVEAGFLFGGTK